MKNEKRAEVIPAIPLFLITHYSLLISKKVLTFFPLLYESLKLVT